VSARDRKIVMVLVPLLLITGYWFVILGPKRSAAARAEAALSKAKQSRDQAVGRVSQLGSAKARFGEDYEAVVKLGKAIPTSLDMPTLIVQLDKAARGTHIRFNKISAAEGAQPASSASQSGSNGSQSSSSSQSAPPAGPDGNADAGGAGAVSAPGRGTEAAGNKVNKANSQSAAQDKGTAVAADGGNAPQGGSSGSGATPGTASTHGSAAPGLVGVPLTFSFTGSFFELTDFLHELKRFVRVVNDRIEVRGRLMTIDGFNFTSDDASGGLKADVSATVYLAPRDEGATGGATAAGPEGASGPPSSGAASPAAAPPTAIATR
jgi:hypothetical protein